MKEREHTVFAYFIYGDANNVIKIIVLQIKKCRLRPKLDPLALA
jgi:hypothetical protein